MSPCSPPSALTEQNRGIKKGTHGYYKTEVRLWLSGTKSDHNWVSQGPRMRYRRLISFTLSIRIAVPPAALHNTCEG